jgi:7,8-dihydropterin-6-yl-methyl-4-(beta-D-ribofuranosyl)aminobenzene 5'-phosphate synthase
MQKGVNRREFLQTTAVTGAALATANLAWGDATTRESTKVQIPEADKIIITMITDNLADANRTDDKIAHRHTSNEVLGVALLHAEHGLAYHIETVVAGKAHSCLYDFGTDPRGVMRNLELLKVDLHKVEALGISHDHYDHEAGLIEILKAKKTDFSRNLPLFVGDQFFAGTYAKRRDNIIQINVLKKEDIDELGFITIMKVKDPTPIIPGAYLPGKIEQVTDYEQIAPSFLAKHGSEFVQETFPGEQAVILNAKGKGLVVLSSCAHRGIVNTVKHAQKMTGIEKVHAIIGGCHLINAKPEVILKTVADIKAINPDYIAPTHCTGFEAISAFAREMPDKFILNTAGTKYVIGA